MRIMRMYTLLTWFFVLLFYNGFSQNFTEQEREDHLAVQFMNKAPYIIEGTVIESECYKKNMLISSSNLIQIDKIFFKNDSVLNKINCGTIEILTKGGEVNGNIAVVTPGPSGPLPPDGRAIFLLWPSTIEGLRSGLDNELDLRLPVGKSTISVNSDYEENGLPAAGGLYQVFDTHEEMYNYIDSLGFSNINCHPKVN
ncbi:hypothetical protein [Salibacter halophilus]|uniref:Uncharacterized protein n=1 Tax=Salibacter halophilus TaxID=1803916 RepID=A0A6N6M6N2_9FLAO|nr:hypothetical protein [Salibacter halophilus]KAB1064072.1 hypothetical protein F3059_08545 [Salibacter halophilus]